MNTPNIGKYASVGDLPYTTQTINYNRGYGNIVIHEVKANNAISTNITKFNRIEPLSLPFGTHLPIAITNSKYEMFNPQTNIAWADKRFI